MRKINPWGAIKVGLTAVSLTFVAPYSLGFANDKNIFLKNCGVCHTLSSSEPRRQGPTLADILGRKAGTVRDFPYSKGLKSADWVWSVENLDRWLQNPQSVVPDSYMMYRQKDPIIRQRVIQFLKTNPTS